MEGTHMIRAKKRKRQQCCDLARAIDTIEKAAPKVAKIYPAIEPIATAILANRRKTK